MHARKINAIRHAPARLAMLLAAVALGGCNPNLDVDGALVPAWVIAGAAGVAATVAARAGLIRAGLDRHLVARPAVYLSLGVTFTCLVWIVVFRY
ncbi:MAG: hypothetical protein EBQ99_09300 [Planctomycetes bacterium]|nr:hypothetical protein [Planctomycetota bacterium]